MTKLVNLPREIMLLNQAANALSEVVSIDTIKKIRDKAEAYRLLGKKFQVAEEITVMAASIKLKAIRRIGEVLLTLEKNKGGRPAKNQSSHDSSFKLEDLGISRAIAAQAQQIAKIPAKTFNSHVHREVEANREPTIAGVVRIAKQEIAIQRTKKMPRHEGYVTRLDQLIEEGKKFSTIYADPPWDFKNRSSRGAAVEHFPTMTLDEIKAEPVAELVGSKAHCHIWVPSPMLPLGISVLEAWGFRYVSCFVWTKAHIGTGNYYRTSHEFLLFGDRNIGDDQEMLMLGTRGGEVFLDHSIRSWQEYPRREHSRKPDQIVDMIEKVSLPPYLELYSRNKPKKNWTSYGNQIIRS